MFGSHSKTSVKQETSKYCQKHAGSHVQRAPNVFVPPMSPAINTVNPQRPIPNVFGIAREPEELAVSRWLQNVKPPSKRRLSPAEANFDEVLTLFPVAFAQFRNPGFCVRR
jgi:hypothetical protein